MDGSLFIIGNHMFKLGSFSDEIMETMEKSMAINAIEKSYNFNKVAKAAEYLSAAAEIFDHANMTEEAEELTRILESLTK